MRRFAAISAAGLFLIANTAVEPVSAQQVPQSDTGDDHDCDDVPQQPNRDKGGVNPGYNCAQITRDYQSLHAVTQAVRDVVAGRLLGKAERIEPTGIVMAPADALERLSGNGNFAIAPAADVSAEPAAPKRRWNTWTDGKFTWTENGPSDAQTDGLLVNLTGGIDYKITDRFLIGLVGLFETSDLDTGGGLRTSTNAQGFGGGAYVGVTVNDHLVWNALVTGSNIDTDLDFLGTTADINSGRIQASTGLTGYWYFGTTRWSPSMTLAWSKEWQDDYRDSTGAAGPNRRPNSAP